MKTQFQNGTIVTPAFLNAMANAACKKTPSNDGDVKSPSFDELADAGWLTKAILQEMYSSLGLNPGDHDGDPLNGATIRAFIRGFGVSQSERLNVVSKLLGMINTLNGDPADFCMDLSFDVLHHGQRLDSVEADVSGLQPVVVALQQRVSEVRTANISQSGVKVPLAVTATNTIVSLQLPPGNWVVEGDITVECQNSSAPSWMTGPSRVTIDSGDNGASWANYENISYAPDIYVEAGDIKLCSTHVTSKLFSLTANTWVRLRIRVENSVSGASAFGRIVAVRIPAL